MWYNYQKWDSVIRLKRKSSGMKKWMRVALAALLACMGLSGLAEAPADEVIDLFSDVWVEDGFAVEIWFDEGAFHCSAVLGDGGGDADVWAFGACRYDASEEALVCEGGVRSHEHYDEAAGRLASDVLAEGITAVFTIDGDDRLIWTDAEGGVEHDGLTRLSVAEEQDYRAAASRFVGMWACGRASVEIFPEGEGYAAAVRWGDSADTTVEWTYALEYDDYEDVMLGTGEKAVVTYDMDGEAVARDVEYADGAVRFALNGEGMLLWSDAVENAGEDMAFEPVPAEEAA